MAGGSRKRDRSEGGEGEERVEAPPSLEVSSLVEALDTEGMWFPARVLDATDKRVLISFEGWGNEWDEWLAKGSKRLRKHRGWGTRRRRGDWQVGSFCLALDMEDKWCRARILHVSEDAVQVHYQNWSTKWDEWISKCSVRSLDCVPHASLLAPGNSRRATRRDDLSSCRGTAPCQPKQPTRIKTFAGGAKKLGGCTAARACATGHSTPNAYRPATLYQLHHLLSTSVGCVPTVGANGSVASCARNGARCLHRRMRLVCVIR